MIVVSPIKVEAVDIDTKELIFTMEVMDAGGATIEFSKGLCIGPSNINEVTAAMRSAITVLELM